jgi:hypothetical protein
MHSAAVAKAIAWNRGNYDSSANADWIEPDETLRQAGNCQLNSFIDLYVVVGKFEEYAFVSFSYPIFLLTVFPMSSIDIFDDYFLAYPE